MNININKPISSLTYNGVPLRLGFEPPSKDVDFYDCDGTRLYSYTVEEIQRLNELPTPISPDPEYLVFQEWNWTLEELKALNGPMDVGATYRTIDGHSKFFITIDDPRMLTVSIKFRWNQTINWGDGAVTETGDNETVSHTYAELGDYIIDCTGWSGAVTFGTNIDKQVLRKAYLGDNISGFNFVDCSLLSRLAFPSGMIKCESMANDVLRLTLIKCLIIPKPSTGISWAAFRNTNLEHISFPSTLTDTGDYGLYARYPPLSRCILPPNLTGIKTYFANQWANLIDITIPASVTTISDYAFGGCAALKEVHLKPTTPPTLGGTNAFGNLPTWCIFYVPPGTLSAYASATNWSTLTTKYTFKEEGT